MVDENSSLITGRKKRKGKRHRGGGQGKSHLSVLYEDRKFSLEGEKEKRLFQGGRGAPSN